MSRGASRPRHKAPGHKMASQLDRKIIHGGRNEVRPRGPATRESEMEKNEVFGTKDHDDGCAPGKREILSAFDPLDFRRRGCAPLFIFHSVSDPSAESRHKEETLLHFSRHSTFFSSFIARVSSQLIALFITINSAR